MDNSELKLSGDHDDDDVELPYPGKKQQLAWQAARAHREHNMPAVLLYFSITNVAA